MGRGNFPIPWRDSFLHLLFKNAKFGQLIISKIVEIVATRRQIWRRNASSALSAAGPPQTQLGNLQHITRPTAGYKKPLPFWILHWQRVNVSFPVSNNDSSVLHAMPWIDRCSGVATNLRQGLRGGVGVGERVPPSPADKVVWKNVVRSSNGARNEFGAHYSCQKLYTVWL